jgi:hypothetical protein
MPELKKLSESVIFPKGKKIENDYFVGAAWLECWLQKKFTIVL